MFKNKIKMLFMSIMALLVVVGVILFVSMVKSIRAANVVDVDNVIVDTNVEGDTTLPIPDDMVIPTPEPSSELNADGEMDGIGTPPETIVVLSGTVPEDNASTQEELSGEKYRAVKKDCSWEEAQKAANAIQGGHLVTISTADELQTVIKCCISENIDICWIGCHRDENGKYIWENNEEIDIDSLHGWGYGEPSYTDQGEKEDYIMIWWMNGTWSLNDSSNDPYSQFPKDYEDKMGYIVEVEQS